MSTASLPDSRRRVELPVLHLRFVWASLAIAAIWTAVALVAIFGSDIVTRSAGGDESHVPSGIVVALLATIATWAVAHYGLRERRD